MSYELYSRLSILESSAPDVECLGNKINKSKQALSIESLLVSPSIQRAKKLK